jgi:hypothetical protein
MNRILLAITHADMGKAGAGEGMKRIAWLGLRKCQVRCSLLVGPDNAARRCKSNVAVWCIFARLPEEGVLTTVTDAVVHRAIGLVFNTASVHHRTAYTMMTDTVTECELHPLGHSRPIGSEISSMVSDYWFLSTWGTCLFTRFMYIT